MISHMKTERNELQDRREKNMARKVKKLQLTHETVRRLDDHTLIDVAGGVPTFGVVCTVSGAAIAVSEAYVDTAVRLASEAVSDAVNGFAQHWFTFKCQQDATGRCRG